MKEEREKGRRVQKILFFFFERSIVDDFEVRVFAEGRQVTWCTPLAITKAEVTRRWVK